MWKSDRRQFLQESGLALVFVALNAQTSVFADAKTPRGQALEGPSANAARPLYNTNVKTAIGLGDESAGIVDQFGNLDSRNAKVCLNIGTTSKKSPGFHIAQSLEDGYLPIVQTEARSSQGSVRWAAYASKGENVEAEYLEITRADVPVRVQLWFPFTTQIEVKDGVVIGGGKILASFPAPAGIKVAQAKYNLMTPARDSAPAVAPDSAPKLIPGIDPAFSNGRGTSLFRPLHYKFPVQKSRTYHVVLGLIVPKSDCDCPGSTQILLKLSVNGVSKTVNLSALTHGKPFLHDFAVQTSNPEILVTSEPDPSSTFPFGTSTLNAIWVFDSAVDLNQVAVGALSKKALFYVPCGAEPMGDRACSVTLDYPALDADAAGRSIHLPYNLPASDHGKSTALRMNATKAAAKQRWESLIERGAQFTTGDDRLDHLYKTSLINIFLLRTKFPGQANGGEDLYVVKPGAADYNAFWYRDGAYIITALDAAGQIDEAEKSLRLFWQSGLPGIFRSYEQQESGFWQAPEKELDGQGQALWSLVHHAQFSGNREWLKTVYPNIRKGAAWIRTVTEQMRYYTANGDRPIYYGLLPAGIGETIGEGYIYYFDFWAILGLRMAIEAATALHEEQDVQWMTQVYSQLDSNLSASLKLAYERVARNRYIPADPYHPDSKTEIWGSLAALYPSQYLSADDPMMTRTLDLIKSHSQEDEFTYFNRRKIWTYITVDWAMCYLLRGDLDMFCKLFDGYVAHASPTNGWIEEIYIDSRIGTGDMPHGWAAAQYVHLHRNSLVYEDKDVLHLCWGARAAWLNNGITVKQAPTKFGMVDFEFHRTGGTLAFDYQFARSAHRQSCRQVLLHIPPATQKPATIRINGKARALTPDQHTVQLD